MEEAPTPLNITEALNVTDPGLAQVHEMSKNVHAFLGALYPGVAYTAAFLTVFLLLRRYFPDVYEPKRVRTKLVPAAKHRKNAEVPTELPLLVWDWVKLLVLFKDEDILQFCGADALMFLRFLRMGFYMACAMCVYGLAVLLPLNATGMNGPGNTNLDNFDRYALSNVQVRAPRLWAHLLSGYVFTIIILTFLYRELSVYANLRQRYMKAAFAQNYSLLLLDLPTNVDATATTKYLHKLFGSDLLALHLVEDVSSYKKLVGDKDTIMVSLVGAREKLDRTKQRPRHKTGLLGLRGEEVDSISYYEEELATVNKKIAELQKEPGKFKHAALATFDSIRVAMAFKTIPFQLNVRFMSVLEAPAPQDLIIEHAGTPALARSIRTFMAWGACFALIFFYTVPVTFVASLANLQEISKINGMKWLGPVVQLIPDSILSFIQGFLPPLILSLFFSLVPTFMNMFAHFAHIPSKSQCTTTAIQMVFLFVVFDYFLVFTIAGATMSKVDQLMELLGSPIKIIDLFATTLPAQSTFFITYIMQATFINLASEILRGSQLVVVYLKRRFLAHCTWDHLNILTEEQEFQDLYGTPLLVFLAGVCFSTQSPLILLFMAMYFGLSYAIWLNQLVYVYDVGYHTGGTHFPVIFRSCVTAVVIYQVLLMGVLGLKQMALAVPVLTPLIMITVMFGYKMTALFKPVGNILTLENLTKCDQEDLSHAQIQGLKDAYSLKPDEGRGEDLSPDFIRSLPDPYGVSQEKAVFGAGKLRLGPQKSSKMEGDEEEEEETKWEEVQVGGEA